MVSGLSFGAEAVQARRGPQLERLRPGRATATRGELRLELRAERRVRLGIPTGRPAPGGAPVEREPGRPRRPVRASPATAQASSSSAHQGGAGRGRGRRRPGLREGAADARDPGLRVGRRARRRSPANPIVVTAAASVSCSSDRRAAGGTGGAAPRRPASSASRTANTSAAGGGGLVADLAGERERGVAGADRRRPGAEQPERVAEAAQADDLRVLPVAEPGGSARCSGR